MCVYLPRSLPASALFLLICPPSLAAFLLGLSLSRSLALSLLYALSSRRAGPAGLPKTQSTAARASLTSLHMGKNIVQKKEIIKGVK